MGRRTKIKSTFPQSREGKQMSEKVIQKNVQSLLQRQNSVDSAYGYVIKQFEG